MLRIKKTMRIRIVEQVACAERTQAEAKVESSMLYPKSLSTSAKQTELKQDCEPLDFLFSREMSLPGMPRDCRYGPAAASIENAT